MKSKVNLRVKFKKKSKPKFKLQVIFHVELISHVEDWLEVTLQLELKNKIKNSQN